MNFTTLSLILQGIFVTTALIYLFWLYQYNMGVSRIYDDFMQLLIKHKELFEDESIYNNIEDIYTKREHLSYETFKLIHKIIKVNTTLNEVEKRLLLNQCDKYKIELLYILLSIKNKDIPFNNKVRPTTKMPMNIQVILISICLVSLGFSIVIRPLENKQVIKEYQKAGIEKIDDRYSNNMKTITDEVTITDRYYKSRLFGGAYYKFTLQITKPYKYSDTIEVDPVLYSRKKIGDTLKIQIEYRANIDHLKNKENDHITNIKILE